MGTVRLYKNAYEQQTVSFNLANIDLSDIHNQEEMNALDGYWNYGTGTYAYTGDTVHTIRFALNYQNMTRLTNYVKDIDSDQNIHPRPRYKSEKHGTPGLDEYIELTSLPNLEAVPIGQKPSDWDSAYMRTYFYKGTSWDPTGFKIPYYYPATSVWHDDWQYYRDTSVQTMYYTGSQGFFGVSRYCAPLYSVNSMAFLEVVGVALPFGQTSTAESTFAGYTQYLWKSGGYGGILVNDTTNPYYMTGFTTEGISDITDTMVDGIHFTPNKILVQMCEFDFYDGGTYKGVAIIKLNSENIATEARVIAISDVFWTPIDQKYAGPISSAIGGNGTYYATDTRRGKRGKLSSAKIGNVAPGHSGWKLVKIPNVEALSDITDKYYDQVINSSGTAHWIGELATDPNKVLQVVQNSILSVYRVPIEPTAASSTAQWQFMGLAFNLDSGYPIGYSIDHYEYLDCGTVSLSSLWYDSFLDYDPYTQVYIYLPFIGTFELPTSEVMGGSIGLEYHQDNLTGDLVARVYCSNSKFPSFDIQDKYGSYEHLIGEFQGNGAMSIPFSVQLSSYMSGLGQIMKSAVGGAVSGGKAGGAIAGGAAQRAKDKNKEMQSAERTNIQRAKQAFDAYTKQHKTADAKAVGDLGRAAADRLAALESNVPNVAGAALKGAVVGAAIGATISATSEALQQFQPTAQVVLGSCGSNTGYMCELTPYIKVVRSIVELPKTYGHEKGYPANITYTIQDLPRHSFNVCDSLVDFNAAANSRMTVEEKQAILGILNSGFYR